MTAPDLEITTRRFFPSDDLIATARRCAATLRGLLPGDAVRVVVERSDEEKSPYQVRLATAGSEVSSEGRDLPSALQRAFEAMARELRVRPVPA